MSAGPVRDIASFAEALRGRGMTVTPDQMSDMARSLTIVNAADENHVYAAFRALSITDPNHRIPFDEEFRRFFYGAVAKPFGAEQHSRLASSSAVKPIIQSMSEQALEDLDSQVGASAVENVAERDFRDLDENDLAEARRLVMSMMWQPTDVRTRRWLADSTGKRPDPRRTLRGAVGPEGDLLRLEMRKRRTRQRPLILIADISGSMERYADMFLVFAHAAGARVRHLEAFTFSTHLTRITDEISRRSAVDALTRINRTVTDWSGGTKIGEALEEWNRKWSRRMARGGPVVLILSDGWDCGDPKLLSEEMGRLSRSVHKVIWLNPLAARADYRPATRGMKAILPHIDHLLPAASVHDLRGVVRILESIAGPYSKLSATR
ncbi:MAG: VWA domain-containing protein [Actinomycetota bacterium]|nr:VWA domain-containing protein [Actinomycetota bacterium]